MKATFAACMLFLSGWAHAASDIDELAGQRWIRADSAHFRVVTEQSDDVARRMLADLENLRFISSRVRGVEALPGPPLTVLALGKRNLHKLGLQEGINGVFTISRLGYAALAGVGGYAGSDDAGALARATLLHEYHHFLLHLAPETIAYPAWYDEGMAEYWSSLTIEGDKASFGRPVGGFDREYWLVDKRGNAGFDTKTLFNTAALKLDGSRDAEEAMARFYAQARYAVHYFNSKPELRQQLDRYLRLFNDGVSQDQAVRLAFGKSYAELDKDMAGYIEHRLVGLAVKTGKDGLNLPPVEVRTTRLDLAGVHAVLADLVPRFGSADGKVVGELIAANLAHDPNNPDAQALAMVHLNADDEASHLVELLARHPDHPRLLGLRAESLRIDALARRETGATDWKPEMEEARKLFRRAIAKDSQDAFNYYGLGFIYTVLPDGEALNEGIVCLDTAAIFNRDAQTFRALANLYLRNKQLPQALKSIRSAVAFAGAQARPFDLLLMENLELLTGNGKPDGQGKWTGPNGSYYEGGFANGLPSGKGKLVSERGVVYEGDFVAGVARGQGRIAFPAGDELLSYQGGVDYALPSGAGVLNTVDGPLQGTFMKGLPHGPGVFTPIRKPVPIKGEWLFGRFDWPAAGNTIYTGGIDANGERDGTGWCRGAGAEPGIEQCVYKAGKRMGAN